MLCLLEGLLMGVMGKILIVWGVIINFRWLLS